MSESTSWTPGVAADYYNDDNEDYLCVPGVAAAYSEEYLRAPGVRFAPSDQELIVDYLGRKLRGEPLPNDVVRDGRNAYAEHPKKLVPKLGEDIQGSWYLFSPRRRKYVRGMRPKRDMGDNEGHWKATGAEKPVLGGADGKVVIGTRRALTFHEDTYEVGRNGKMRRAKNKPASKPSKWKMVEFVCSNSCRAPGNEDTALDPMLLNDFVLCKITDKSLSGEGEGEGHEEEQPTTPDGGGGEPYEKHVHLREQQAGGGGAASHGNQQPALPEAPLPDVDPGDFFYGVDVFNWFANANSMSPFDLYDAGPVDERQKPPGMLSP